MKLFSCSAIVLAGGRATRLGGIDKALVSFKGRPLITHVLERLAPQVDDIVINCNRNEETLSALGYPLVGDKQLNYSGPLMGVISALPRCRHELILIVPCDTPFLPSDLYSRLAERMSPDIDLVLADDGERMQPLFMLLRRHLIDSLRDYHQQGQYKVVDWCRSQKMTTAVFTDKSAFTNLNTEEELRAAENTKAGT
jgi:molybdopterin-guanine dinucleotide biosynthesis protein A